MEEKEVELSKSEIKYAKTLRKGYTSFQTLFICIPWVHANILLSMANEQGRSCDDLVIEALDCYFAQDP